MWRNPRYHSGIGHLVVLTTVGDVLLGPQLADELNEFLGAGIAMRLIAFGLAVRSEVVLAGHDVYTDPAAGQMVQTRRGGREVRRSPVAGPDRDEWLECRRPRGKGGGDGDRVRVTPTGADQCPLPAVVLEGLRLGAQGFQAVVVDRDGVATVSRRRLIGDVPEELQARGLLPVRCRAVRGCHSRAARHIRHCHCVPSVFRVENADHSTDDDHHSDIAIIARDCRRKLFTTCVIHHKNRH